MKHYSKRKQLRKWDHTSRWMLTFLWLSCVMTEEFGFHEREFLFLGFSGIMVQLLATCVTFLRPQNSQKLCLLLWTQVKWCSNAHTHTFQYHLGRCKVWGLLVVFQIQISFSCHQNWFKLPLFHIKFCKLSFKSFTSLHHLHTFLGEQKLMFPFHNFCVLTAHKCCMVQLFFSCIHYFFYSLIW